MAVSHVKSNTVADWTGTVTVGNSTGGTQTIAATDLVRPGDWNSAHNQYYTLSGNTLSSSTASGTNVVFAASGGVSLVGSNDSVVISAPAPVTHSIAFPFGNAPAVAAKQFGQNSVFFAPMALAGNYAFDNVHFFMSVSQSTSSDSSYAIGATFDIGFYTRNNSSLSLVSSANRTLAWTMTSNNTTTNQAGMREVTVGISQTLTDGDWWLGIRSSTATTNANWASLSHLGVSNVQFSGALAVVRSATQQAAPGQGIYTVTTGALPESVAFTQINGTVNISPPWMVLDKAKV